MSDDMFECKRHGFGCGCRDREMREAIAGFRHQIRRLLDERDAYRRAKAETEARTSEALEALGEFAGDAVQVGEDGPECRVCGCELGNDGQGHRARCALPMIEDALHALSPPRPLAIPSPETAPTERKGP